MTYEEQEPVEKPGTGPCKDKEYTHPAFGQIMAARIQGQTNLYGSDFSHHSFVEISISQSTLQRGLARDWHFAGKEFISVYLSEAQWVSLIASMNHGSGTPCTIRHVAGKGMPGIPSRNERMVVKQELDERVARVTKHLDEAIAGIEANLVGLSKAKQAAILASIKKAQREVSDSLPFAAKSFAEHTEATVEKAKVEIEAYMTATIAKAGLTAIANGQVPLMLPTGGGES